MGWGRVESDMASPRLLSAMQNYQFGQKSIRRSVRIASIPLGNRAVVRFGKQLSQKVDTIGEGRARATNNARAASAHPARPCGRIIIAAMHAVGRRPNRPSGE